MDPISGLYVSYKRKSLLFLRVDPRYLDHDAHGLVTAVLNDLSYSSMER